MQGVYPQLSASLNFQFERLTGSCPIHVLKSDSEVKRVVTSVSCQSDVDHITLSDGVVL